MLLLADVFEEFRNVCLNYYSLDPAHYYTSPGLSWDAALKMTKINLELITDVDMFLMIEKGIRGGISTIMNRYSRANNKYLSDYNPEEESKYIIYLDANGLYSWAMTKSLPYKDFEWVHHDCIYDVDYRDIQDDDEFGYILEADLAYPDELHDQHSDYPLAPDKMVPNMNMLSKYSREMHIKLGIGNPTVQKLIPTLSGKTRYVLHHANLQLYLSLGLELIKIHRVIKFRQKPWLKEYIDFNIEKRKIAKNNFEKDFFKLMNNSVFGKTMENLRKRVNVRLVNKIKTRNKLVSRPNFKSMKIFNENLVAINMKKINLCLNRPIYCGFTILDISKTLMYDFHYNTIRKKYGNAAKLLFTDTDSLCYELKTDDIYKDIWDNKELFDLSDYPTDHKYHDSTNKKVLGKFKDETGSKPIIEFVGLRAKMYSILTEEFESKKAKGIKKSVVKNKIKHQNYKETLLNSTSKMVNMKTIRSDHHNLKSYKLNKIGLSCYDDKRYILDNGCDTIAYGHYRIQ